MLKATVKPHTAQKRLKTLVQVDQETVWKNLKRLDFVHKKSFTLVLYFEEYLLFLKKFFHKHHYFNTAHELFPRLGIFVDKLYAISN